MDDENGDGRALDDPFGDTPEIGDLVSTGSAVRPHHDDVNVFLVGVVGDCLVGNPFAMVVTTSTPASSPPTTMSSSATSPSSSSD